MPEVESGIPKHAILALSQALRRVLKSDTITPEFKAYILDVVLRSYFNLKKRGDCPDYAETLRSFVAMGGEYMYPDGGRYWTALMEAFGRNRTEYYIIEPKLVKELEDCLLASEPHGTSR